MNNRNEIRKYFSGRSWIFLAILFPYGLIYFSGLPELVSRTMTYFILVFLLPVGILGWYCWNILKEIRNGKEKSILEDKNRKFVGYTRRKLNFVFGLFLIGLISYEFAVPVSKDIWGLCSSQNKIVQVFSTKFTDVHILAGGLYFIYQSLRVPGFNDEFYLLYFLHPCRVDKYYELKYLDNSHVVISLREISQK